MILFKINQCDDFYGTLVKIRLLFSNIRSYCFKLTICFLIVDGVFGIRFVNAGFQVHTFFCFSMKSCPKYNKSPNLVTLVLCTNKKIVRYKLQFEESIKCVYLDPAKTK